MKGDGIALVEYLISMVIYGTVGVFRRYTPLPSASIAFYRGVIGSVFLLQLALIKKRKFSIRALGKRIWPVILSGAMIGANWVLLFESFNHTTVAIGSLCNYMAPVIIILLTPFIFKERLTAKQIVCTVTAIVGMVFVSGVLSGEGMSRDTAVGIALGLGAAVFYAGMVLVNKTMSDVDPIWMAVIQLASSSAVLVPYLALTDGFVQTDLDFRAAAMLVIMGLLHTGVAYALYFGGMAKLSPTKVALFSYVEPVLTVILSATLLGETATWQTWLGVVMIIGSLIAVGINKKRP